MKPTELLEEEVSRRTVLAGAAALGGTMVAAHFFGKAVASSETVSGGSAQPVANVAQAGHSVKPIATTASASIPDEQALPGWKVQPFPLGDVEVTGGVFTRARDGMLAFAKAYPIERMLACFRTNAGLDDGGVEPSGGWENYPKGSLDLARKQSWGPREYKRGQNKDTADGLLRGHYAGHFLSMLGQAYAESKDAGILKKINDICAGLKECRDALAAQEYQGSPRYSHPGFLAAYGEWQFSALEEYAPYGEIWAPWYTEHKILAGLISCYQYAGNKDALDLAEGIGHWTYSRLSKCKPEQLQKMWDIYIGGEYGGMNESLVDLYAISEDPDKDEFLKASKFFNTNKLLNNCAVGNDILNDLHANQHIPQFVGYAKEAGLGEKDAQYLKATEGFWGMIVPGRMYAHGGTGEGELWGPAHTVAGDIGKRNAESCAAYNMLKVSRYLFFIDQKPKYMDYYERTLLNHILGGKSRDIDSKNELSPGNCYMYPVHPAAEKEYGDGNIGTCCGGTALESHSKYQDSIYFHSTDNTELYVNLYIPSTVKWKSAGLELLQETNYPEEETSLLTIQKAPKSAMTIKLRIPAWAEGAAVSVNGTAVEKVTSGDYVAISRTWSAGDKITVTIPLALRIEATDDRKDIQALFYGPTLLNALNPSGKFIARGFYERNGLDGSIKLGIEKKPGTKNYFIIDGDEFEPAYNGNNTPYHMYFQRADTYVGFAGKVTNVRNPKRPATGESEETTLMDEIWSAAPFENREKFLEKVKATSLKYQKDGLLSSRSRQTILLAAYKAKMK